MARTKRTAARSVKGVKKTSDEKLPTKKAPASDIKRKRRQRPGSLALREIRKYQKGTDLVIRKLPFQRLIREQADIWFPGCRFSTSSLSALQECTESYLTGLMEDSQLCTVHARRQTLFQKDMVLAKRIRGDMFGDMERGHM